MNLLGNFTPSVNTRVFWASQILAAFATPFPTLINTWSLDPKNPFFRIFAAGVGGIQTVNSFATTFQFFNSGASAGDPITCVWGKDTPYLDGGTVSFPFCYLFGSDIISVHSQYAGACLIIGGATLSVENGFISRWTNLADSVKLTTGSIGAFSDSDTKSEVFHGVLQQQW
jgi:hypothetical protein